ncbi:MAG: hypothetical protein ACM3JE_00110 [Betaproteobacteria bacterium]
MVGVNVGVGSTMESMVLVGDGEAFGAAVGDIVLVGVVEGSVGGEGEFVGFTDAEDVGAGVGLGVGVGGTVEVGLFVGLVVGGFVGCAVGAGVTPVPAVTVTEGFSEYVSAKTMFSWLLRAEADITNWSAPAEIPVT